MGNTALTLHILHAMAEMHVTMPLQVMYPSRGSGTTLLTGPLAAIQTETAAEMEEMQEAAEEEEYVPPATQQVRACHCWKGAPGLNHSPMDQRAPRERSKSVYSSPTRNQ